MSRAFFTDAINALSCYRFSPNQALENDCIVSQKGLAQIVDYKELDGIVSAVLEQLSDKVNNYRSGKKTQFVFFIGSVMKLTGGRADPVRVNQILWSKLDE